MPKRNWTKGDLAEIRELLDQGERDLFMLVYADGESLEFAAETLGLTKLEAQRMLKQIKFAVVAWIGERKQKERERQLGVNDAA